MKMKVLIASKDLQSKGGVSNLYRLISKEWNAKGIKLEFFSIGSSHKNYRKRNRRHLAYFYESVVQFKRFHNECKCIKSSPDIVVLNPSLIKVSLIRDGILLLIAKKNKIKTVVFFHGWRESFILGLKRNKILRKCFLTTFGRADHYIVLSNIFKKQLSPYFDSKSISVLYTPYNDKLIKPRMINDNNVVITFISRISIQKGIFELLSALNMIQKNCDYSFTMNIYGHFADKKTEQRVNDFIIENNRLQKIIYFGGYIEENEKYKVLSRTDLFLLPSWAEGCPTSVIEASAAGCFVIATDVGAVSEIIQDKLNGFIVKPKASYQLYQAILNYFQHKKQLDSNCNINRESAKQNFDVNKLNQALEKLFNSLGK